MFKLIIAGGRDFNNYDGMSKCLDRLLKNINDNIEIVCGMARGADRLGERYAKEHGYKVIYICLLIGICMENLLASNEMCKWLSMQMRLLLSGTEYRPVRNI